MRARLVEFRTFELDLRQSEEELFAGMKSACRRAIRKADKEGVRVEEAHGVEFADEYYEQLLDVFERQGRRPPYGVERVREMIRCVEPSGNLLMLRAVAPEGRADRDRAVPRLRGLRLLLGRRELHQPPGPAPQRRDLLARDEALPRARRRAPRPRRRRRLQAQVRRLGEAHPVRAQVARAGAAAAARPGGVRLQAPRDGRTAPLPRPRDRHAQRGRPEHPGRRAGPRGRRSSSWRARPAGCRRSPCSSGPARQLPSAAGWLVEQRQPSRSSPSVLCACGADATDAQSTRACDRSRRRATAPCSGWWTRCAPARSAACARAPIAAP